MNRYATVLTLSFISLFCMTRSVECQSLVEEMRLGEYGSGVDLTSVSDLVVDREGNVYLAQNTESLVRVFSADGRLLHTLGRDGEGPGEFRNPIRLGWLADTLWVFDQRLGRTSLFGSDGEFLTSFPSMVDVERFPLIPSGPSAVLPGRRLLVVPIYPLNNATALRGPVPVLRVPRGMPKQTT